MNHILHEPHGLSRSAGIRLTGFGGVERGEGLMLDWL